MLESGQAEWNADALDEVRDVANDDSVIERARESIDPNLVDSVHNDVFKRPQ